MRDLWFSREELMDSCNEAKKIVKLIHLVGGKLEAIDHSQHCVVGLEKYHGKKEREKYRKMLIRCVLIRQEMNRGLGLGTSENGCLSEISQMMSSSFKEFALWQAAMHEFHAYGSSKPSQSLLASKASLAKRSCPGTDIPNAKRQQRCLESNFAPAARHNVDPIISTFGPIEKDRMAAATTTTTTTTSNTLTHNVQNPLSLHQDMVKVMEGYVERKRLRCEVGNLVVESQYQPHPHQQHRRPLSYSSSARTTESPLLQARR